MTGMKKGLLLINIGTPEAPDNKAVRRYLKQFLGDRRVVNLPVWIRYLILYGWILPFRTPKSAKAYQSIWTKTGSPLLVYSKRLVSLVQQALGDDWKVVLGMRYGNPDIPNALSTLEGCDSITILPLFPQYASASTGSAVQAALQDLAKKSFIPSIAVIHDFHQIPSFIESMAEIIKPLIQQDDFILFSYHGLPEKEIHCHKVCENACDINTLKSIRCYRAQCFRTSSLLGEILQIPPEKYMTAFQSRLGKTPWIQPFTDFSLDELAKKGVRNLLVACPSFVTDCLETIEEIGMRARKQWIENGGQRFTLVPCLNDSASWVKAICDLVS